MSNFYFKINNFDVLRLLAAFQVVIIHSHEHLRLNSGETIVNVLSYFPGVPVFFVISGYLISASLERSGPLSSYFINRILRIFPALWFSFFLSLIILQFIFPINMWSTDFLIWAVAQLSFVQFYNPSFLREFGVGVLNGSLWTIPIELQFYLLLPLFYFLMKFLKWRLFILLIFFVCSVTVNVAYTMLHGMEQSILVKLLGVSLLPYFYMFLIGVLLQKKRGFVERFLSGKIFYWFFAYVAFCFITEAAGLVNQGNLINPISATLLAFLVISFAYSYTEKFSKILRGNDISYGLYIYHMLLINVIIETNIVDGKNGFISVIFGSIGLAFFSWRFLERPALRLKNLSKRSGGSHNKVSEK